MALKEYKPGTTFPGRMGRTIGESEPGMAVAASRQGRRAERALHRHRRHRIWPARLLRLADRDAEHRQAREERPAVQQHAYDRALFAVALLHPDRAQSSFQRDVLHHRGIDRLSRRQWRDPVRKRLSVGNASATGLRALTAIGKWHLTPSEQISAAGPYDRWPLGRGFERYYGFLGGDTHQYYPDLVYDNHQVEPPKTPEEGYHLTADLADKAIGFIADLKQVAPDKPFFLYFAPGANHAPHHVPKEWADKYKGKFDEGWDVYREKVFARQKELGIMPKDAKLSRHDPDVQEWSKLPADERKLYARMMEVFAGFCEHMDHHVGRLIDFLEKMGELDNTLIMFISDNGASSEGGPNGSVNENKFFNNVPDDLKQNLAAIDELGGPKYFNHYAWGWTHAGNTPFKRWKRETYRGGVSDPFLVHWPKGIKADGKGLSTNSPTRSTWSRACSRRSASSRRRTFAA